MVNSEIRRHTGLAAKRNTAGVWITLCRPSRASATNQTSMMMGPKMLPNFPEPWRWMVKSSATSPIVTVRRMAKHIGRQCGALYGAEDGNAGVMMPSLYRKATPTNWRDDQAQPFAEVRRMRSLAERHECQHAAFAQIVVGLHLNRRWHRDDGTSDQTIRRGYPARCPAVTDRPCDS